MPKQICLIFRNDLNEVHISYPIFRRVSFKILPLPTLSLCEQIFIEIWTKKFHPPVWMIEWMNFTCEIFSTVTIISVTIEACWKRLVTEGGYWNLSHKLHLYLLFLDWRPQRKKNTHYFYTLQLYLLATFISTTSQPCSKMIVIFLTFPPSKERWASGLKW